MLSELGALFMRPVFGNPNPVAREIGGQFLPGRDKIVRSVFGDVARVIWPQKTAAELAAIARVEERTAKRWLSGEFEPPGVVLAAIFVEITRRA